MHTASIHAHRALLVSLAVSLAGCALPSDLDIAGGRLQAIGISGDTVVAVGDSTRLTATGSVSGLVGILSYDPLADARWSTSNPGLVTVMPIPPTANDTFPAARVLIRGMSEGTATISVSARGISAQWLMHVVAPAR